MTERMIQAAIVRADMALCAWGPRVAAGIAGALGLVIVLWIINRTKER